MITNSDDDLRQELSKEIVSELNKAFSDGATRMREACVEKVRERAGAWREERYMNDLERRRFNAYAEEADKIANALESLTLDQVEQKQ